MHNLIVTGVRKRRRRVLGHRPADKVEQRHKNGVKIKVGLRQPALDMARRMHAGEMALEELCWCHGRRPLPSMPRAASKNVDSRGGAETSQKRFTLTDRPA